MTKKVTYIALNYYCHRECTNPEWVITKHYPTDIFLQYLGKEYEVRLIKFMGSAMPWATGSVNLTFFKRSNSFWQIPFSAHRYIKRLDPDIIIVQGIIFPLQVMALRRKIGPRPLIVLQHQGEVPFRRKKFCQQIADKHVDGYLFTSIANADEWLKAGIIRDKEKCFEIPAAVTSISRQDKNTCREKAGMRGSRNFLWVGRLNANKDPLTVLKAFGKFCELYRDAKLYMIYQEEELLEKIEASISSSTVLQKSVVLVGKIPHEELEVWYNASDFFILASHREGGSYALMEAMACGCVPIVSNIPASAKMIGSGEVGFLFSAGDADSLHNALLDAIAIDYETFSEGVRNFHRKEMSAEAVATKMTSIIQALQARK